MQPRNDLITMLKHFDLDDIDAHLYIGLLQIGPLSVGNLAAKLDIERGKAYRSLEKLRSLGLITTTMTNPIICKPVEPQEGLTNIIQRKENEFITMQKLANKLSDDLRDITRKQHPVESATVSIIQGRHNIYSRVGKLFSESKSIVYVVTTGKDLVRMYHTSIPEKIKICKASGGQIRIVTDVDDPSVTSMIGKLGASEIRIGKLPSKSRMIVEEGKRLLMSGGINESMDMNDDGDSVLDSNSIEMVENMYSLCEHLWKRSKSLEPIKRAAK
ncbi:MAG: ArsR family transcriptional regulator [Thaumarchaeota archaeon]|nr:ArsR family transcriptional regulator [Nitrososphaerota archaeon]